MKAATKRVNRTRTAGAMSAAVAKAALRIVPGVMSEVDGRRFRIGFTADGTQVQVPYTGTVASAYPFDLRPVGGHLWMESGSPVRCMSGCSACKDAKFRVARDRI